MIGRRTRLAAIRIIMTPLEMRKKTTPTTLVGETTIQTTTTQGPLIYSKLFSEFLMSVALLENFQLPVTLKPYDGTGDSQVHMTMFKLMMLVNGASDLFLCKTFPAFLEKGALLLFSSLPAGTIHNFAKLS